jgi:hypothetical protein
MINFVLSKSSNYSQVQSQINKTIQKWLPADGFTESLEQYVDGALNFTLFIDKPADVLMSHGAADKNYMWRKTEDGGFVNLQRRRQHLFVPGKFLVKRIRKSKLGAAGLSAEAVGWPRLDGLIAQLHDAQPHAGKPRVLYAPTHDYHVKTNGVVMSSYPEFMPFFEQLQTRFDCQMSVHPRNRKEKAPTFNALLWADVVVSDHGTMVWEALALGKVVIFPTWIIGERMQMFKKNSAEWHIFEHGYGWHAHSFDEMVQMIENPSPMSPETRAFVDHYLLPSAHGCSGQLIAQRLMALDAAKQAAARGADSHSVADAG